MFLFFVFICNIILAAADLKTEKGDGARWGTNILRQREEVNKGKQQRVSN